MSRHGYVDDFGDLDSQLQQGRWRAIIASATRGKRGQRFFLELVKALDALPVKELVEGHLETAEGAVCALGALGIYKGVDIKAIDTEDWTKLGETFDVAEQLTQEVMWENDEMGHSTTPAQRWQYMRAWAMGQLRPETLVAESENAE
jgi:hypothetical protein